MKRRQWFATGWAIGWFAWFASPVCGADDKPTHESVLKEIQSAMIAAVDLLSKVEDESTATQAVTGLKEQAKKLATIRDQAKDLPALKADEVAKLKTQFEEELRKAGERFGTENKNLKERVAKLPLESQKQLAEALEDYSSKLDDVAKLVQKWIKPPSE